MKYLLFLKKSRFNSHRFFSIDEIFSKIRMRTFFKQNNHLIEKEILYLKDLLRNVKIIWRKNFDVDDSKKNKANKP